MAQMFGGGATTFERWRRIFDEIEFEINVFGRQAPRLITDHETEVTFHRFSDISIDLNRLNPIHFFFKKLQIHHEVGVVFHNGLAFFYGSDGFHSVGKFQFEKGWKGPIRVLQELTVNVPARLHISVKNQIDLIGLLRFMNGE